MGRYGKTNGTIVHLIEKARKTTFAHTVKDGKEVYRVTYQAGFYNLYHYGTRILVYDTVRDNILDWGGYSSSDRDALNTFLDEMGHPQNAFFRILCGGLILTIKEAVVNA